MATFQLRDGTRVIAIVRSPFVVGRHPACHLRIDDPEIAPRHALFRLEGDDLVLHDMAGGAQATRLNGEPVDGEALLAEDDVVSVGRHSFVVEVGEASVATAIDGSVTQTLEAVVPEDPVALRLAVLRRALATATPPQAVALMTAHLERFSESFGTIAVSNQELVAATEMAVRLLAETGSARWLDRVLDAHRALGRMVPGDTVDQLFTLAAQKKLHASAALDHYVEALRAQTERLNPAERFVLQRLTGLRDRLRS